MATINLTTQVRQGTSHTITIDNPFSTPINMVTSVTIPDITIPNSFQIGAESQVNMIEDVNIILVIHMYQSCKPARCYNCVRYIQYLGGNAAVTF